MNAAHTTDTLVSSPDLDLVAGGSAPFGAVRRVGHGDPAGLVDRYALDLIGWSGEADTGARARDAVQGSSARTAVQSAATDVSGAFTFTAGTLTYAENFDSLAASGTANTGAAADGGTVLGTTRFVFLEAAGSGPNTAYAAGNGSSNSGNTYSFGTGTNTDRAIGSVASGTVSTIYYGTLFTNNTGSVISSLAISYVGEQWRAGGRSATDGADRLSFTYSTSATTINGGGFTAFTGLDFVSPSALPATAPTATALDGNAAANRQAIAANLAVDIPAGGTIFIRWTDINAVGSDDGLAIDDFSITATLAGTPPVTPETIAFATTAVTLAEGSGTDTTYSFTLTRTGSTAAAATVGYAIAAGAGTTTDATDFTGATGGTATFAAGSDTAIITITVAGDRTIEGDESFVLALSNPSAGYVVGTTAATATGTITNDDLGGTFAIARVSDAAEGGTATFTITRTDGEGGPVTIGYAVGAGATGTSADAADFGGGFPSGSVTFAAGETSKTIAIATTDDAAPEDDESFTVTLGTPSAGSLGTASSATGLIFANDPAGSVSVADVSVDEAAGVATITLTRIDGTGAITVGYATADGTATDGADYTATAGTATFAEGVNSVSFDVPIANDNLDEANETFTVVLTAGTGAPAIGRGTATVTIVDNDEPAAVGRFDIAPATLAVREGNTAINVLSFTVTRTDGTTGAVSIPYTVSFTGTNPADRDDFTGVEPLAGTVRFEDGDAATKTIQVQVQGDYAVEADETFTVALGAPSAGTLGTQASATATILNDDATYAIASGRAAEGSFNVPLVVTRTGDVSASASLRYDVSLASGDTAGVDDFIGGTLPGGVVFFDAGAATTTINVPVANDAAIEGDETFTVTLSGAPGQGITTAVATGTIVNDDFPALSIADASVIEGNDGVSTLTFTVTASAPAGADGISFRASTADGTASAGSDYGALTDVLGTIAAGQTSTTVTVAVGGDTLFERNETLTLTLSSATGATIARGVATGTIVNDEPVPASARIFATAFDGFAAAGFAPTPGAGQLDSDVWRVVGLSDNTNPAYGTTLTTGDFARGLITGAADPTIAGVYAPAADRALVFQATGGELESNGFIEARIQNTSGATATSFDLAFDWAYRNSADRASSLQLAYSTDGTTYTSVAGAAFTTPGTAPRAANGTTIVVPTVFSTQAEAVTVTGTVADGGYLYLRWIHASSAGSGNRDEVGIDNLFVDARLSSIATASVADVSVTEGNGGDRFATFTVTRSNGTTEASVAYATADGSAIAGRDYAATSGTLTFAVGEVSKTVQVAIVGDTVREADERFSLILSAPVGFEVPQPRAVATIVNDDTGPVAIYDIQGLGHASPFAGQVVATAGVVTALASNGFYLQDAVGDGNVGTSDGIFVFTDTAPTVAVGNAITLSATVEETRGHNGALTLTRLATPTAIAVTAAAAPLPAATVIATDGSGRAAPTQVIDDDGLTSFDPTTDGIDFYESLEGMLVTIRTPRVVADTTGIGATYVVASDGVGATGLNSRSGMTISAGDINPETIQIFRGGSWTQGDTLNDVTGVMTYFSSASTSSGSFQLNPTATVTAAVDRAHPAREATTLTGTVSGLSYASFNVENLTLVPDPENPDRNTAAEVDTAFARHAIEVVNGLRNPDVIGLQEIQDADGAGTGSDLSGYATAAKLIAAIEAAGGPSYRYVEVTPTASTGGQEGGFIRPGYLYNPERVAFVEGSARVLDDAIYTGTRRPLLADFLFNGQLFTAIDMHSTSRGGSGPLYGSVQPPVQAGDGARTAQAAAVKAYVDGVLAGDPNHLFVVNGDFNGFPYETALDRLAPVSGTGALVNLINALPVEERYTYYFDGYYQSFDNVIVSQRVAAGSSIDIVHYNAGYTDGLSATDHDQPVALIGLARTGGAAIAVADGFTTTAASVLRATVTANDTGGDASLTVIAVDGQAAGVGSTVRLASGALLTLTAGGGFAYNPDGAYAGLAAGVTATDSFSYTLGGGSTATATITVTGVATPAPDAQGRIQGTNGDDVYGGTAQADYFDLSAGGNDRVAGGAGADAFFFGAGLTGADRINGGSGMDQVGIQGSYTGANRLVLTATTLAEVEVLAALPGGSYDIVLADGVTRAGGAFTVFGGNVAAGETFTVDGSAVTAGPLTMYGGLGVDTLTGGAGNDGFYFGPGRFAAGDSVRGGGGGNDQIGLDGNYTLTLDARMDVELVALLAGPAEDRNVFAITVADDFIATGGTKTIYARFVTTAVTIDAAGERDGSLRIFGGQAGDTITGGSGNDRIFGGEGADVLRGGAGADVFVYDGAGQSTGRGFDRLLDFDYGSDRIEIAGQVRDIDRTVVGGRLDDASFDVDLQTALGSQLSGGAAVLFTAGEGSYQGRTFLVVDADGIDGYLAGGDYVIELASPAVPVAHFLIA